MSNNEIPQMEFEISVPCRLALERTKDVRDSIENTRHVKHVMDFETMPVDGSEHGLEFLGLEEFYNEDAVVTDEVANLESTDPVSLFSEYFSPESEEFTAGTDYKLGVVRGELEDTVRRYAGRLANRAAIAGMLVGSAVMFTVGEVIDGEVSATDFYTGAGLATLGLWALVYDKIQARLNVDDKVSLETNRFQRAAKQNGVLKLLHSSAQHMQETEAAINESPAA